MWKRLLSAAALFLSVELASAASTTTPNLGLIKPEAATGSWGEDINRNFDVLDAAFINAAVSDPVRTLSGRGCSDTGSTDDYACSITPPDTAYFTRALYFVTPATINDGAARVNFNGLGWKDIKRYIGGAKSDPAAGDICVGQPVILQYDGTDMIMQSPPCNPAAGGAGTPGGSTTQFQFNSAGVFGGDAGATYDSATDTATFGNVDVGTCAVGCVAYDSSNLTAEQPRVLLNAPGDEVISTGSKVTGNCLEWDAQGRLVDSGGVCGGSGGGAMLVMTDLGANTTCPATMYMAPGINGSIGTAADVFAKVPRAGTLNALSITTTAIPASQSLAVTVQKNGADTASTCTIAAAGTTCSNIANTVSFAQFDTIKIKLVCSGGAVSVDGVWASLSIQ